MSGEIDMELVASGLAKYIRDEYPTDDLVEIVNTWAPDFDTLTEEEAKAIIAWQEREAK